MPCNCKAYTINFFMKLKKIITSILGIVVIIAEEEIRTHYRNARKNPSFEDLVNVIDDKDNILRYDIERLSNV